MPFLLTYIDVRTAKLLPPAESWLVNPNFPFASRMQGIVTYPVCRNRALKPLYWFIVTILPYFSLFIQGVLRVRKRVTLMGVAVTAIFGLCWAPDIFAHNLDYFTSLNVSELAYAVIHMLVLFSSAVNPFVYALVNKTFREKLKGMICCSCTSTKVSRRMRVSPPNVTSTSGTSSWNDKKI